MTTGSLFLALLLASAQAGKPAVTAQQALQLAEEALAPKNADGNVYVSSLTLVRTAVVGGRQVWNVAWSEAVPGVKPGSHEVGLEIRMDGSVVHLVKGRGTSTQQALPH